MRYSEISEASGEYNLQARYDEFNVKYFGGQLPKIPLSYKDLKNVGGKVVWNIDWVGPPPNKRMVRLGYADKYKNGVLRPGSMKMIISSLFKRTEEALDGILLHEMIHVYFLSTGRLSEEHGVNFMNMVRKIRNESGIDVPRRDETEGLELAKDKNVALGILLVQVGGQLGFKVMTAKNAHEHTEAMKAFWSKHLNSRYKEVKLYTVATPIWTRMAADFPVARNLLNGKLYVLKNDEALQDLLANGHELFQLQYS
jgi:hypothetical protein